MNASKNCRFLRSRVTGLAPVPKLAPNRVRLQIVQVKGDGRCAYRALLRSHAEVRGYELSPKEETKAADKLRYFVIGQFKKRREYLEGFVAVDGDFDTYLQNMEDT